MESQDVTAREVRVEVKNIGGIERTEHSFDPGVTLLTGRNATNRTSLLQAIMAGLGSNDVSLKGDADNGSVQLEVGDEQYTRSLSRQGGSIQFDGNPYLDDSEFTDLFAFLLESNRARRAVELDDDLRDIIMEPIDANRIQAEIRQYKSERDDVDDRINGLKQQKKRLPELEQRRNELDDEIEAKAAKLEDERTNLDELSTDVDEVRADESELERKMQTLQNKRSSLNDTEFRLDSEMESLESLLSERDELESEYDDLTGRELANVDHIDAEINQLREQKQRLENELNKLQNVIQFNEEMLGGTSTDIVAALRDDESAGSVTDELLEDGSDIVCWTCGTEVEEEMIEHTLDRLRNLRQSKYSNQRSIDDELSELKEQKRDVEAVEEKRDSMERRLANISGEIDQRQTKIDELESQKEQLLAEIEQCKTEIEELESQEQSEVLDAHETVNKLELELERLENERDSITEEIDTIEERVAEIEELQTRRDQLLDKLDELRGRIDRIENEAVEEFNDHMSTILDILDYDNLERIWVERIDRDTGGNQRTGKSREFRLHIVRSTADGVTYEDAFEHLSESEREVTGLIFALAGYLAHDVYEDIPFILLDSLEAIDSTRIATLVDYMQEYAEYLVVALLFEDASALDDEYQRITDI